MPVQPQYSFGPIGESASPDGNHVPAQIDGSARYVRDTPPRTLGVESSVIYRRHQRLIDSPVEGVSSTIMHREPSEGYGFGQIGEPVQFVHPENSTLQAATGGDVLLQVRGRPEPVMQFPIVDNFNVELDKPSTQNEFQVLIEDFPALPRIAEAAQNRVSSESSPETQSAAQQTSQRLEGEMSDEECPSADNYTLSSLFRRLTSTVFCTIYRKLNFEDLTQKNVLMHPRLECAMEAVTRDIVAVNLQIGVIIQNSCNKLQESEDMRVEDPCYRNAHGHIVPVPENDKYYAMSDVLKDKLRNPRLQTMDDLTLFFQFYTFTRDTLQLIAADALFQRNWRWNKKVSLWCRLERIPPHLNQTAVFQVYDPVLCRIQQATLQYIPTDFELLPPVIPLPVLRNVNCSTRKFSSVS